MKKILNEQLSKKYTGLYKRRIGDRTLMRGGVSCGDGWYLLLDVLSELLTVHNPEIQAVQVKEKFGTPRFYHSPVDKYTSGIEIAAGQLSSLICEKCGSPAKTQNYEGCVYTLCDKHKDENPSNPRKPSDLSDVQHLELGIVWSEIIHVLLELCRWFEDKNNMPKVALDIMKINDRLVINAFGGDSFTMGMIDLFAGYANRVDEHSGAPK